MLNEPTTEHDRELEMGLEFGTYLGDLLQSRGLTAAELARRLELDQGESRVQKWVSGERVPGFKNETVWRIPTVLELNESEKALFRKCLQYSNSIKQATMSFQMGWFKLESFREIKQTIWRSLIAFSPLSLFRRPKQNEQSTVSSVATSSAAANLIDLEPKPTRLRVHTDASNLLSLPPKRPLADGPISLKELFGDISRFCNDKNGQDEYVFQAAVDYWRTRRDPALTITQLTTVPTLSLVSSTQSCRTARRMTATNSLFSSTMQFASATTTIEVWSPRPTPWRCIVFVTRSDQGRNYPVAYDEFTLHPSGISFFDLRRKVFNVEIDPDHVLTRSLHLSGIYKAYAFIVGESYFDPKTWWYPGELVIVTTYGEVGDSPYVYQQVITEMPSIFHMHPEFIDRSIEPYRWNWLPTLSKCGVGIPIMVTRSPKS